MVRDIKARANKVGRKVRCVDAIMAIWDETRARAEAEAQKILDHADREALEEWMAGTQLDSKSFWLYCSLHRSISITISSCLTLRER